MEQTALVNIAVLPEDPKIAGEANRRLLVSPVDTSRLSARSEIYQAIAYLLQASC